MSPVSFEQREQILTLLREGRLSREEIAARTDVTPPVVSAIKAHITMGSYDRPASSDVEIEELIDAAEVRFGLERDLQQALRSNIDQLEPGLRIVDGGTERVTDAGRVDILAEDKEGTIVVVELKAGDAPPEALTQLLAYMGALREEPRRMRGILVAGSFHRRLVFAARAVPDVSLRRYSFRFTFESP